MGYMFQSTNVHMRLRYICEVAEYRNISQASALCCDTEFPLHYSLYLYTFWFISRSRHFYVILYFLNGVWGERQRVFLWNFIELTISQFNFINALSSLDGTRDVVCSRNLTRFSFVYSIIIDREMSARITYKMFYVVGSVEISTI